MRRGGDRASSTLNARGSTKTNTANFFRANSSLASRAPKTGATCLYLYSALAGIVSDLDTYTDLGAIIHDNQGHDLPFLRSMR
jgi:hypothetical protein